MPVCVCVFVMYLYLYARIALKHCRCRRTSQVPIQQQKQGAMHNKRGRARTLMLLNLAVSWLATIDLRRLRRTCCCSIGNLSPALLFAVFKHTKTAHTNRGFPEQFDPGCRAGDSLCRFIVGDQQGNRGNRSRFSKAIVLFAGHFAHCSVTLCCSCEECRQCTALTACRH